MICLTTTAICLQREISVVPSAITLKYTADDISSALGLTNVLCEAGINRQFQIAQQEAVDKKKKEAADLRDYLFRVIDAIRYLCCECDALFSHEDEAAFMKKQN